MAFQKDFVTSAGITANYWSIKSISVDFLNKIGNITLCLFLDSDAKGVNGFASIADGDRFYGLQGDNFPFTPDALSGSDLYSLAYGAVLANDPFFSDADIVDDVDTPLAARFVAPEISVDDAIKEAVGKANSIKPGQIAEPAIPAKP